MDAVLSIMVLACFALVLGALALWRRGVRRQAMLMLVLAAIVVGNIAIWVVPNDQGKTLVKDVP